MIEKNVKTKLDFDGREIYWSAKNNWKVKRFLCICLVEIKLLKEKVLIIQVAPSILATGQDCWADVLGRSDPHHMLNSMQDDRRAKMSQKIARNN